MPDQTTTAQAPVDNATYNLLQTITTKLEAIEVYDKYLQDADDESREYLESCRTADRQSAERGLELLRSRLSGGR